MSWSWWAASELAKTLEDVHLRVLSAVQDSAVDLVEKIHQNECVEAKGVKNKSISRL
jgi:hypothetical protein